MNLKTISLPGRVTQTGWIPPKHMSEKEIEDALGLIAQVTRSVGWWAIDAVLYAEAKLSEEKFYQIIDALGVAPHTMQNMLSVGRAFPLKRRRAALALGHHEALAKLDVEDQEHWLDKAETGDKLPNGEMQRWSVARLRKEMKALPSSGSESDTGPPESAVLLTEGSLVEVRWASEGVVRYRVTNIGEIEGKLDIDGQRVKP